MKIIKVIFFTLLALGLVACTGIFIFFQTFDTDQYLPQITQKAALVLGRPVSVGHVGLGLSRRGITLDVGPLIVVDDADFTTQPFIKVDLARISVDLSHLILHREIRITSILLQSPQIHFIRSWQGTFNVQSIMSKSPMPSSSQSPLQPSLRATEGGEAISKRTTEMPKSIIIQDASISFIDQNLAMPLDIWLNGINARVDNFSFSKPFPLSISACLYSDVPNVHANTFVSLDLINKKAGLSDFRFLMDLSQLDTDKLKDITPQPTDSTYLKNIAGIVQLNLARLDIGTPGDLEAKGEISITDGIIKNFNIIKTLFSHTLGVFGGMEGNVDNLLNGRLNSQLGAEDTIIEKAQAQFLLHDKILSIDDSLIQTNIFEFTARGTLDEGLNMDMQTNLHLNSDVSDALVNELKGLKYLMDDTSRITIGASLKGKIPHLKYKPNKDFRKKSKKLWMEEGGNILGILLGGR